MGWHEVQAAGLVAAAGLLLAWVLAAIAYIEVLRSLMAAREQALQDALHRFAELLTSWQIALSGLREAVSRESIAALDRLVGELQSEGRLREKIAALDDARPLIEAERLPLPGAVQAIGQGGDALPSRLREARRQVEAERVRYNAAAADAAFVSERPPLSLLSAAAGLAARPLLASNADGKAVSQVGA